jgi:hypothetical protein
MEASKKKKKQKNIPRVEENMRKDFRISTGAISVDLW